MGLLLKDYPAPKVCKFTPEQLQDPVEVIKYAKEEMLLQFQRGMKLCNVLASGCCLLDIAHYQAALLGEREESRSVGTVATQTAAEPGEPHGLVAVAPIKKKKSKTEAVGHSTRGRSRARDNHLIPMPG